MVTLKVDYANGDVYYADDTLEANNSGTNIENTQTNANTTMHSTSGGQGVLTGCQVRENSGGADMSVDVQAGTIAIGGENVTVTAQDVSIDAADGANPRIDLIMVGANGTADYVKGTAAATPLPPAWTADHILIGTVYVAAADASIVDEDIIQTRELYTGSTVRRFEILVDSTNQPNNTDNNALGCVIGFPANTFKNWLKSGCQGDCEGDGGAKSGYVKLTFSDAARINTTQITIATTTLGGALEVQYGFVMAEMFEDLSDGSDTNTLFQYNLTEGAVATFTNATNANLDWIGAVVHVEITQNPDGDVDSNLHKFWIEGY